jgi:hypothetical protein
MHYRQISDGDLTPHEYFYGCCCCGSVFLVIVASMCVLISLESGDDIEESSETLKIKAAIFSLFFTVTLALSFMTGVWCANNVVVEHDSEDETESPYRVMHC